MVSKKDYANRLVRDQLILQASRRGAHPAYLAELKRLGWVDQHGAITDKGREVLAGMKPEETKEYPAVREPIEHEWSPGSDLAFSIAFLGAVGFILLIVLIAFYPG